MKIIKLDDIFDAYSTTKFDINLDNNLQDVQLITNNDFKTASMNKINRINYGG